jgi:hypothetical protein
MTHRHQRGPLRATRLATGSALALLLAPLPPVIAARVIFTPATDELVQKSQAAVEGTLTARATEKTPDGEAEVWTLKVEHVLVGPVRPGDELRVGQLRGYSRSRDLMGRGRTDPKLAPGDRVVLFLSKPDPRVRRAGGESRPPEWLVPECGLRLVEDGNAYPYVQTDGPFGVGPLTTATPAWRERFESIAAEDFRRRVRTLSVELPRELEAVRQTPPEQLAGLIEQWKKGRTTAAGEVTADSVLTNAIERRIAELADTPTLLSLLDEARRSPFGRNYRFGQTAPYLCSALASRPDGRMALARRTGDITKADRARHQDADALTTGARAWRKQAWDAPGGQPADPDFPKQLAIQALAAKEPTLRGGLLRALEECGRDRAALAGAFNASVEAAVAELAKAWPALGAARQYETILAIRKLDPAMAARLKGDLGPLVTLVEPDARRGVIDGKRRFLGRFAWFNTLRPDDPPITLRLAVVSSVGERREWELPFESEVPQRRDANKDPSGQFGSAWSVDVILPPEVPRKDCRFTIRVYQNGARIGEGFGFKAVPEAYDAPL